MLPGRCLVWREDVTPSLSGLVGVGAETFPRNWSGEGCYCKQASWCFTPSQPVRLYQGDGRYCDRLVLCMA